VPDPASPAGAAQPQNRLLRWIDRVLSR
jgi:hypothetical protein